MRFVGATTITTWFKSALWLTVLVSVRGIRDNSSDILDQDESEVPSNVSETRIFHSHTETQNAKKVNNHYTYSVIVREFMGEMFRGVYDMSRFSLKHVTIEKCLRSIFFEFQLQRAVYHVARAVTLLTSLRERKKHWMQASATVCAGTGSTPWFTRSTPKSSRASRGRWKWSCRRGWWLSCSLCRTCTARATRSALTVTSAPFHALSAPTVSTKSTPCSTTVIGSNHPTTMTTVCGTHLQDL